MPIMQVNSWASLILNLTHLLKLGYSKLA